MNWQNIIYLLLFIFVGYILVSQGGGGHGDGPDKGKKH